MNEDIRDISTRGALVAAALAILAIAILVSIAVFRGGEVVSKIPDKKKYQAVFLTNGDIYFGKLENIDSSLLTLKNVFYVRAAAAGASPSPSPGSSGLQLVNRGQEIHGPQEEMRISSANVVFWENLKDDSKVVEGIKAEDKK